MLYSYPWIRVRIHDTTNIAAALRYNARKNRRILKLLELLPA